nr:4'-phosphopantetheinyl transferase superfamily protein [uncultured Desulfobacter sp.]
MIKTPPVPDTGHVHIYYTRADRISDPGLLEEYRGCLCAAETQKADRYMKQSDRHLSLVSKALVRYLIGAVTQQDPKSVRFSTNEYGKPFLTGLSDFHFNLSHSHGVAVCALRRGGAVGVDVEDVGRRTNLSIAGRFFSPAEADLVSKAPDAEKRALFFDIWTLKEAYIKAVGRGLSIPLNSFSFNAEEPDVHIRFSDTGRVDSAWQFSRWRPEPGKIVAAAAQSASVLVFKHFWCVPFVGIEATPLVSQI